MQQHQAAMAKVNNRADRRAAGAGRPGGSAFHGTDWLDPEIRPRNPANHADRRDIERRILTRQPRRSRGRTRSDVPVNQVGAVGVIDAALASAPDPLTPEHRQVAREAFKSADRPSWIA